MGKRGRRECTRVDKQFTNHSRTFRIPLFCRCHNHNHNPYPCPWPLARLDIETARSPARLPSPPNPEAQALTRPLAPQLLAAVRARTRLTARRADRHALLDATPTSSLLLAAAHTPPPLSLWRYGASRSASMLSTGSLSVLPAAMPPTARPIAGRRASRITTTP